MIRNVISLLLLSVVTTHASPSLGASSGVGIVTTHKESRNTPTRQKDIPVVIRHAKLEPSTLTDEGDVSSTLTFDVYNEGSADVSDLVLLVSVLGPPRDDAPESRTVLVRPFRILVKATFLADYSLHYEISLRNLSSDCDCVSHIEIIQARVAPVDDERT